MNKTTTVILVFLIAAVLILLLAPQYPTRTRKRELVVADYIKQRPSPPTPYMSPPPTPMNYPPTKEIPTGGECTIGRTTLGRD
jgi:hypothetical protein